MNRYWTPQRKAEVVLAVKSGRISLPDAAKLHGVPVQEITRWMELHELHGVEGLRVTFKPGRASA